MLLKQLMLGVVNVPMPTNAHSFKQCKRTKTVTIRDAEGVTLLTRPAPVEAIDADRDLIITPVIKGVHEVLHTGSKWQPNYQVKPDWDFIDLVYWDGAVDIGVPMRSVVLGAGVALIREGDKL